RAHARFWRVARDTPPAASSTRGAAVKGLGPFIFALSGVCVLGTVARALAQDVSPGPAGSDASVFVDADAGAPEVKDRTAEDGAPVGHAAPPTEAATRGTGTVRAGLEVFAQYSYRNFFAPENNRTWFHAFDVPRVHGAVEGSWEQARGRVVLEAVRSASE